jgi:hypothetical protein
MQDTAIIKRVHVKIVGSDRAGQNVMLAPGATTRDLLRKLGLDAGYQISDARNDVLYGPDEVLFARVQDGDLVHASAMVDAGN